LFKEDFVSGFGRLRSGLGPAQLGVMARDTVEMLRANRMISHTIAVERAGQRGISDHRNAQQPRLAFQQLREMVAPLGTHHGGLHVRGIVVQRHGKVLRVGDEEIRSIELAQPF